MSNYIYKYIRNNEIIYIGKTINLTRRHKEHLKEDKFKQSDELWYFTCKNKHLMDVYEIAFINKYHPILNIADNYNNINFDVEEPEWIKYNKNINIVKNNNIDNNNTKKYKDFEIKEYTNIFKEQQLKSKEQLINISQINIPKLPLIGWKLLTALYLKNDIMSISEYLNLSKTGVGGGTYKGIKKVTSFLANENYIKIINDNCYKLLIDFPLKFLSEEQLLMTFNFTSKHSYELLLMLDNTYRRDDIMNFFDYTEYKCMTQNVFKTGLSQINKCFNMNYIASTIRNGRKIEYISFINE